MNAANPNRIALKPYFRLLVPCGTDCTDCMRLITVFERNGKAFSMLCIVYKISS